jgi:hypothetical protein
MAEYDAFGNPVGGDAPKPTTPLTPEPAAGKAANRATERASVDLGMGQGQGGGVLRRVAGLGVLAVVIAAVGGVVIAVKNGIESAPDVNVGVPAVTVPTFSVPTVEPGPAKEKAPAKQKAPAAPAQPAAGLHTGSLIRHAAFARALDRLRAKGLGRLVNLRVAAERLDIQLVTAGGRLRNVQVVPGPEIHELSLTGPGFGSVDTVAYSTIDTTAPERMTRESARRRGVSTTKVDYLVPTRFSGQTVWNLYFKDGVHYAGDAAGHFQRKP